MRRVTTTEAIREDAAHAGAAASIGRVAGPLLGAALVAATHPGALGAGGLGAPAAWTLGLLAWMAIWWMTHAAELAVTSLLPVIALPMLGVQPFREVAANYADQVIFLFAGGATLGWALERHGLSARFVGAMLSVAGRSPAMVVAALLVAAACVSAFVSNLATTAAMLPLAAGVATRAQAAPGTDPAAAERARRNLSVAALLAIAYGSSIGGGATIVGSPPNPIAAQYLADRGEPIDFVGWLAIGAPVAAAMSLATIAVLLRMLPVRGIELVPDGTGASAPWTWRARATLAVFLATVLVWTTGRAWPAGWRPAELTDGAVAISAAALLMLLPARDGSRARIVPWSAVRDLPWGVFVLFGGGLAIADAMQETGLSEAIGRSLAGLGGAHPAIALAALVGTMAFASEIASNTALTATAVPIVGALATSLGLPVRTAVLAATFGASYAFMLPVGTPPNALVFATGRVPQPTMMRVGLVLNLTAIALITAMAWVLMR
jgi:sodium-dependent dicarboxylate transporter 2/3/5